MRILYFSAIVVLLDQITKIMTKISMTLYESIPVLGDFFRFTYIENEGMAFGISINNQMLFSSLSVIAALIIFIYLYKIRNESFNHRLPLALIFGGAIGNLIDRLLYSRVVDFMDMDIPDIAFNGGKFLFIEIPRISMTRWPVFNIADVAVTIGMLYLFIIIFFGNEEQITETDPDISTQTINE